ncbi:MAG: hypothetical protein JNK72_26950, partial [Myxococcales bacterium]|nr:hypothetical protein [Myxococcales bacterium]
VVRMVRKGHDEGRAIGHDEGRAIGHAEGHAAGEQAALDQLVAHRLGHALTDEERVRLALRVSRDGLAAALLWAATASVERMQTD